MPFGIPDTRQFPWDAPLSQHLGQLNSPSVGGVNTWSTNPTVGVDGLTLGVSHTGYTGVNTSTSTLVRWNGSAWVQLMDSPKIVSTPKLVLYVSQNTGNDANDGLTSTTAWQTISKLYQELMRYNFLERQVDIHLGAGAYVLSFPTVMRGVNIRIYGVSNSTVTIQRLAITGSQNVTVQDVTIGFPQVADNAYFFWPVTVTNSSSFNVGPNVIFGSIGNFVSGYNRRHITVQSDSAVTFFANSPVTITGSVNGFCSAASSSRIVLRSFSSAPSTTAPTAPAVSNGVTYDSVAGSLTSADVMTTINCIGSLSIERFFDLYSSSLSPGRSAITGNVVGLAYCLTDSSYIDTSVIRGTPAVGVNHIGFPNSISPGTKDTTSTVYGTTF